MVAPLTKQYVDLIKTFKSNCATLIDQFKNKKIESIKTFLEAWQSLNFNFTYEKKYRKVGSLHDFKNDSLEIAKLIMLNDHFSGGAFLLYGLYSLQDFPKGTIRLEHNEFCHVLKMLRLKGRKDLINDKDHKNLHLQLAFVFCTFFKANALDFVLFKRQYDIEGLHYSSLIYNKKYEFDESDSEEAETKSEYSVHKVLMQIPKKLIDLEKNYFELKSEIKSVPHLNLSLEMVEEDFSTTLWKALTRVSNGEESEQADDRIGKRRRALKNRKMHALQRYSLRNIDENFDTKSEPPSPPPPPKEKKKRRHGPKFFFTNAINDPDEGADCVSETEEIIDDKAQKQEPLPDFM